MKNDEQKEEEKITSTEKETEIKEVEIEQENSVEEISEQNEEKDVAEEKSEEKADSAETKSESQEVEKQEELKVAQNEENTIKQEDKKEEVQEQKNETKANTPKKKNSKVIVSAIVAVIAIVVALVLWLVLKTKTIDLAECLNVKYTGYSGHATATVELNEKALKSKIDDSSVTKNFIKKLEYEVENPNNLSNGDELVVKVKISSSFLKDNKLKLKDTTIKIKVEGIEEATSVDMSKYIKIEYTGFNNHATAKATLLKDKMKDDLGNDVASKLESRMNLVIENNGSFANNDEVEIKLDINSYYLEEIGVNLDSDTVKIKVEGLRDATEIDAFKDIKIDLSGMSPNISVSISNNSEDECLKTVQYKASKTSGIANGETITITAVKWDEELFNEKAVALKETTMEYNVKGQAAYIFSLSEINDTVKNELKTIFISKATSNAKENYEGYNSSNVKWNLRENTDYKYADISWGEDIDADISIGTPEVMSMYLLTKKDSANVNQINTITGIVKVPCISAKTGVTYNWYVTIQATNASLKQDGTISDNTDYSIDARDGKDEEKAYQTYINSRKDKYNVDKISL